jgi:hypothetical protein
MFDKLIEIPIQNGLMFRVTCIKLPERINDRQDHADPAMLQGPSSC